MAVSAALRGIQQACQGVVDFHEQGHMDSAERMARTAPNCGQRTLVGKGADTGIHLSFVVLPLQAFIAMTRLVVASICSGFLGSLGNPFLTL